MTSSAVVLDTVKPRRTAGIAETMNPITGTKSDSPAITASSSAAGTFSSHSTRSVAANAMADVMALPTT